MRMTAKLLFAILVNHPYHLLLGTVGATVHSLSKIPVGCGDSPLYVVFFKSSPDISYIHQDLQLKASATYHVFLRRR